MGVVAPGAVLESRHFSEVEALVAWASGILAIDLPIGLPDAGPRACDREARRQLGRPRSSSVFPAPIRPMLGAETHPEACEIGASIDGRRLPIQSWHLLGRIRALDTLLRSRGELRDRVFEALPELSFQTWKGAALGHGKKSREGRAERTALVDAAFGVGTFAEHRAGHPPDVADDDLLDAFALLFTALRIHAGTACTLPDPPPADAAGLPMRIVR